jgi:sterol desaturase/sphingolipid hydroxylase (fatty acid hydroxylase superfamily)
MDLAKWTVANESALRFAVFAGAFGVFALAETFRPDLPRLRARLTRWKANLGLAALSTVLLRLLLPGAAVLAAVFAAMRGWGALNTVDWPFWLEVVIAVALLDLAIYAQHVLTHRIPVLWRLHQVHHADREVDVSTALRFHPVEMILSMLYKCGIVVALGAPAVAVIVFEVLLNACAMFNHANLKLPRWFDAALRPILVTPDMHRIHHSQNPTETDRNFGFCLAIWDRLFGTYRASPATPLTIGLAAYRDEQPSMFAWCLMLPFRGRA